MSRYIHDLKTWPKFTWDAAKIAPMLADVRHRQGRLVGRMEGLGFALRAEATLQTLTQDVLKSSEIEGEILDYDQVRSSIARRLGIEISALASADRHVDGVVEMMLDATQNHTKPLNKKRLFGWHAALFPTGYSGRQKIKVGRWRETSGDPMQVISGAYGKERVHFEAPPARNLEKEMTRFLEWFNDREETDLVIKSAIAHLWFVTIHPFEDGNGRIARAIADMALARSEKSPQRFYSMSAQIRQERKSYYDILESTQKGDLDITDWITWFLACLGNAIDHAGDILWNVLAKAQFWDSYKDRPFNERQKLMLTKMLEGFEGKLTSSKWAKIVKCSPDTALRDITALVNYGILIKDDAGGRSTSYSLVLPETSHHKN